MKSSNRNAAGPSLLTGENYEVSVNHAAWRFLNNPNVRLTDLVELLRQAERDACQKIASDYALIIHD